MSVITGTFDVVSATSGVTVASGGEITVESGASATAVTVGNGGEFSIVSGATVTGTVLDKGGAIDLVGVDAVSATLSTTASGTLLEVTESGGTVIDLAMGRHTQHGVFAVMSDGNGGTEIAIAPATKPGLTAPATVKGAVDQPVNITGVKLADASVIPNETFTVTLNDTNGLLTATGDGVSGAGTTSLTITGSLTDVKAQLATLQDTASGPDAITMQATDSFGKVSAVKTESLVLNGLPTVVAPTELDVTATQTSKVTGLRLAEAGTTTREIFTVAVSDTNGMLLASGTGVTGSGSTSLTITGSLSHINSVLKSLDINEGSQGFDTVSLTATDSFGNSSTTTMTVNAAANEEAPVSIGGANSGHQHAFLQPVGASHGAAAGGFGAALTQSGAALSSDLTGAAQLPILPTIGQGGAASLWVSQSTSFGAAAADHSGSHSIGLPLPHHGG